jgi:ribosome-associated protein YbcJ (S4-like RNA binding protein)
MRVHCKTKNHEQPWTGNKSALHEFVKVQTFFSSGGLQKYFIVDLGVGLYDNGAAERKLSEHVRTSHKVTQRKCLVATTTIMIHSEHREQVRATSRCSVIHNFSL